MWETSPSWVKMAVVLVTPTGDNGSADAGSGSASLPQTGDSTILALVAGVSVAFVVADLAACKG